MKTKFIENEEGVLITLEPETVAETAALLRFTSNKSNNKPDVQFNFIDDEPKCGIALKKVGKKIQKNFINKDLK